MTINFVFIDECLKRYISIVGKGEQWLFVESRAHVTFYLKLVKRMYPHLRFDVHTNGHKPSSVRLKRHRLMHLAIE